MELKRWVAGYQNHSGPPIWPRRSSYLLQEMHSEQRVLTNCLDRRVSRTQPREFDLHYLRKMGKLITTAAQIASARHRRTPHHHRQSQTRSVEALDSRPPTRCDLLANLFAAQASSMADGIRGAGQHSAIQPFVFKSTVRPRPVLL